MWLLKNEGSIFDIMKYMEVRGAIEEVSGKYLSNWASHLTP